MTDPRISKLQAEIDRLKAQIETQAANFQRVNRKLAEANRTTQRQWSVLQAYEAEYGELPTKRAKYRREGQ